MMRIDLECDQPLPLQVIYDSLHVLAIGAHVASEPRNRLRVFGGGDGAEDLPAGAGEPKPRNQPISRRQQQAGVSPFGPRFSDRTSARG